MNIVAPKADEQTINELFGLIGGNQWLKRYRGELIELWNLCDVDEQKNLLHELIARFTVLEPDDVTDICLEIIGKTEEWAVDTSRAFFVATADDDDGVDGSVAGLQALKNQFSPQSGWSEKHLLPHIVKAAREVENGTDIILFDDFIGTGKTVERKACWFRDEVEKRGVELASFRVCAFAAMNFGLEYFTKKTGIESFAPIILDKGISDFNDYEIAEQKKLLMRQLEGKLQSKYKGLKLRDHSLGYMGSETLFNIREQNCSNNVFPVFWWPKFAGGNFRKTLLRRAR